METPRIMRATLYGLPVACSVQAGAHSYAIMGVLDDGEQCHIYAGCHPLPMACRVYVFAGDQQWTGSLANECVRKDGTRSYTLEPL